MMNEWDELDPNQRIEVLVQRISWLSDQELQRLSALEFEHMVSATTGLLFQANFFTRIPELVPGLAMLTGPLDTSELSNRARNSLTRGKIGTWSELSALSVASLQAMHRVGQLTTAEILEWSVRSVMSCPASSNKGALGDNPIPEVLTSAIPEPLSDALKLLGDWHRAVFGTSSTIPHVIGRLRSEIGELAEDIADALRTVSNTELANETHLASVEDLKMQLGDDRLWDVFSGRCLHQLAGTHRTLEAIGKEHGLTRERIRQLEEDAIDRIRALVDSPHFGSLRWRSAHIKGQLGAGVPLASDLAQNILGDCTESDLLALWLAGPYVVDSRWLRRSDCHPGHKLTDTIIRSDARTFLESDLVAAAVEAGVPVDVAAESAETAIALRLVGDAWVRWDGTLADKSAIVLELLGQPATLKEIIQHLDHAMTQQSLSNRLSTDPRFCRVSKRNWALSEWGMQEYSGILGEITKRIIAQGGVANRADIVSELSLTFGVSANSVRAYTNTQLFIVEGPLIRFREPNEDVPLPERVSYSHVLTPVPGRVRWRLTVDQDWRRGSGRNIGLGLAIALGAGPGMGTEYHTPDQGIEVFWQLSALSPHVGSLRPLVESLSARDGDSIVIEFDKNSHEAKAQVIDQDITGVDYLRSVAGIRGDEPWSELAYALEVEIAEVENALKQRHFEDLIPHLPPAPSLLDTGSPSRLSGAASFVDDLANDLRPF